jgi:hypothetical protein
MANRGRLMGLRAIGVLALLPVGAGCESLNAPLYFVGPTFESGDDPAVRPGSGLTLRFRRPDETEAEALDAASGTRGYEVPWIARDKVHVQLTYSVTNLDGEAGFFNLMVDGANEFTKYDSQVVSDAIAEDDPIYLPLVQTGTIPIGPGETFNGILREDDFAEGELDLDALGRWLDTDPASPTFAGVLLNRSDVNPIGLRTVDEGGQLPEDFRRLAVPALIEINVSVVSDRRVRCEYAVRVRDEDDRLLHRSTDRLFQTSPTLFQPPATN